MKKLHAERLLQVVRVLAELPKEKRFSLDLWNKCGPIACAIGWAASDPWFVKRGLKLIKETALFNGHQYYQPVYKGSIDFSGVENFFGLSGVDAHYLFVGVEYGDPTKSNVIRRIKTFVKANT